MKTILHTPSASAHPWRTFLALIPALVFLSGCGPSGSTEKPEPDTVPESNEETISEASPAPDLEASVVLIRDGKLPEAEASLREGVLKAEDPRPFRAMLGYVLAEQGNLDAALEQYETNIENDPDEGENYFNAGSVLRRMGRPAEALAFYRKAGELGAATPEIVAYNQRLCLIEMGRGEELAVETAEKLNVENPPGDWIMTAAAISLARGYVSEGAQLLAMARNTIHPRFYQALATDRFFRQYRSHPEIVEVLTPPTNENPYLTQAVNALRASDFPAVVEAARAAVQSGEPAAESRTLQGLALLRMEKHEEAEAAFRAVIEAAPGIPGGYLNLGELLRATGRSNEAVSVYKRAVEIQPDDPRARMKVALAEIEAGESPVQEPDLHPPVRDALTLARALAGDDDTGAATALVILRENHPEGWLKTVLSDSFFRKRADNPVLAPLYAELSNVNTEENGSDTTTP